MEQMHTNINKIKDDKLGKETTRTANFGDLQKVFKGVADLQTSLAIIKEAIASNNTRNNEIITLTEINSQFIENNIALQKSCTALSKLLQVSPKSYFD